jgi:hypothetical protein
VAYRPELIQKYGGETRDKYLDKTPPELTAEDATAGR